MLIKRMDFNIDSLARKVLTKERLTKYLKVADNAMSAFETVDEPAWNLFWNRLSRSGSNRSLQDAASRAYETMTLASYQKYQHACAVEFVRLVTDEELQPKVPERLVCKECGSDDILLDAWARWNVKTQQCELVSVMDGGHFCNNCGQACSIKAVEAGANL